MSDRPLDWSRVRGDLTRARQTLAESENESRQRVLGRLLNAPRIHEANGLLRFRNRLTWALGLGLAACAAAALVLTLALRSKPLTFEAPGQEASGKLGAFLEARGVRPLPVRFSDGTLLTMSPASRARVAATTAHGATVVLEDGTLNAAVVHQIGTSWRMTAGPFTVLVTGTKFDLRWSSAAQRFELDLYEGHVIVSGPSLPSAGGRQLWAGQGLRIALPRLQGAAPSPSVTSDAGSAASAPSAAATGEDVPAASTAVHEVLPEPEHLSWQKLARGGHYAQALAAAESSDFGGLCSSETQSNLLLLADTARFGHSPALAEQAFRALRRRFPGSHEAAVAAFSLGRIAYDDHKDFATAAGLFRSYGREEPNGPLAREAAGRLIEAYRASGNSAAAAESAERYLATYPSGPHAALARSIVHH